MIEQLIVRVFATRNLAHIEHWDAFGEGSYARHMALGDLYEALPDAIDKIVEAHVGLFGPVGKLPKAPAFDPDDGEDDDGEDEGDPFVDHLEDEMEWIEDNRAELARDVNAIENMIDELTGIYLGAVYKLKRLS